MGMVEKIDDFVVDRVFQPLADQISDWGSTCNRVGMSLAMGVMVISVAQFFVAPVAWNLVCVMLLSPSCLWIYFKHQDYEAKDDAETVPRDRLDHCHTRVILLLIVAYSVYNAALVSSEPVLPMTLRIGGGFMFFAAFCFLACVRNPPRQRFTKMAHDSI